MAVACSILHVDDDDDIRLIVELSLQLDPDLKVRGVSSADEALHMLRSDPVWRPDVLLLDYRLAGTSGVALAGAIKDIPALRGIQFVFLTGRVLASETDQMLKAGAAGVLAKPFDPIMLARDVRDLLQGF